MSGQWSFNAAGFTGDIEKVAELISRIGAILAEPEFGTGSSQVFSPLGLANNFHKDAVAVPAGEPANGEASAPVTDVPANQDGASPDAVATASQADDTATEGLPAPE